MEIICDFHKRSWKAKGRQERIERIGICGTWGREVCSQYGRLHFPQMATAIFSVPHALPEPWLFFRVESIPKPLNPGALVTSTMRLSLGTSTPLYLKCTYPASMFSERTQVNGTTPSVNWLQLTSIDHITQQQKNVHFSNLTWNIP